LHKRVFNFYPLEWRLVNRKLSTNNQLSPVFLRFVLIAVMLVTGVSVFYSVRWIYIRVHYSFGLEIAEVAMAFVAIIIFGLTLVGFSAGFSAKRALKSRPDEVVRICHSLRLNNLIEPVWGDSLARAEVNQPACEAETVPMPAPKDRVPKRGRPPTYSIDRWTRVVSAWENRDSLHNPMTLEQFLCEEFGTYADGSPRISKKSYYDWQKKVHEEALKQDSGKCTLSPN
jgi:hypothetical protein